MRKDCMEDYTYQELEQLVGKYRQERDDAVYELELYRKDSRQLRYENRDLKQQLEFNKKEHEKTFIEFCQHLFPKFVKEYPPARRIKMHVIKDEADGMIGIVKAGFGTNELTVFMKDESIRLIDTYKKDWIQ